MAKSKKKSKTHTGQTKVVSGSKTKIGDTPYKVKMVKGVVEVTGGHRKPTKETTPAEKLEKLYNEAMKHPASAILKSVRENNWKEIEKDFKLWANDSIDGSLCYYSDNQIREILIFFKKRFVR